MRQALGKSSQREIVDAFQADRRILVVMQETTDEINQMKRSSLIFLALELCAKPVLQVTSYRRGFEIGSLLLTHQKIITLLAKLIMTELVHGLLKGLPLRNGTPPVRSYGSMATVRDSSTTYCFQLLMGSCHGLQRGQERAYYGNRSTNHAVWTTY
jgi:hypothetical protein